MHTPPLYFAGQPGAGFGWGVCNERLLHEISQRRPVEFMPMDGPLWKRRNLPGPFYTPVGALFDPLCPARGTRNYAYTFFENLLNETCKRNARQYDLIFAGSTWNAEVMREGGITHSAVLIQGVNHAVFHPDPATQPPEDNFYLFSGGKFELRKGQDLVLRAFQILRQRHANVVLICAWVNQWPDSIRTMAGSPYLQFELTPGTWAQQVAHLCLLNGIEPSAVRALPLLPHERVASIYRKTHLGVFPNRCEGGTNLVLMEYMACGRPVIAANWTGHTDVVHERNALLLHEKKTMVVNGADGKPYAHWYDASLEELVEKLEWAYQNREKIAALGQQGAEDLKAFTWSRAAETMLEHINFA